MLEEFLAVGSVLFMVLAIIILYLAYTHRAKLLSPQGKEVVKANILIIRLGAAMGMVSLFLFLVAESADILSGSTSAYNLKIIHVVGESLHVVFLVITLGIFLHVLDKVRRIEE
ncbi:MAG: hypothetical protein ACE5G7_02275 [Candidatus Hydrothermarchaeaceae archaeon]